MGPITNPDIAEFGARCPNFQQVEAKHQKLGGLLQEIKHPTLKWEDINMDFLVSFPRTETNTTPYGLLWIG